MFAASLSTISRPDEKHAFSDREVVEVIDELQQEFASADLRVSQEGGG
jgi:hypothetical protein